MNSQICITNIEQLFPRKSSPKKKKQQTSEEPEPTPVAALVDTLIGYLDKSTSFLRTIANQAFNLLSSLVDRESIDLILTVCFIVGHLHYWLSYFVLAIGKTRSCGGRR